MDWSNYTWWDVNWNWKLLNSCQYLIQKIYNINFAWQVFEALEVQIVQKLYYSPA